MVSQLVRHERIETTVAKAKELRKLADRVVTWGKEVRLWHTLIWLLSRCCCVSTILLMLAASHQGDLHARRKAAAVVRGDDVLQKVFTEMAERYKDRDGGYTRILRTRQRTNDAAHMAYIE